MPFATVLVTASVTFGVMGLANMLPMVIKFVLDSVKILKFFDLVLAIVLVMLLLKDEFEQFDQYSMMDS